MRPSLASADGAANDGTPRRGAPENGHTACSTTHGGSGLQVARPPSSCPVRLLAPWSSVQHVSPHLRGMVEGSDRTMATVCCSCRKGSTQPSLPAAPGTPDAASSKIAMVFHGDLLSLPAGYTTATHLRGNVWWWWCVWWWWWWWGGRWWWWWCRRVLHVNVCPVTCARASN